MERKKKRYGENGRKRDIERKKEIAGRERDNDVEREQERE